MNEDLARAKIIYDKKKIQTQNDESPNPGRSKTKLLVHFNLEEVLLC
jgi:hypothetical protein